MHKIQVLIIFVLSDYFHSLRVLLLGFYFLNWCFLFLAGRGDGARGNDQPLGRHARGSARDQRLPPRQVCVCVCVYVCVSVSVPVSVCVTRDLVPFHHSSHMSSIFVLTDGVPTAHLMPPRGIIKTLQVCTKVSCQRTLRYEKSLLDTRKLIHACLLIIVFLLSFFLFLGSIGQDDAREPRGCRRIRRGQPPRRTDHPSHDIHLRVWVQP